MGWQQRAAEKIKTGAVLAGRHMIRPSFFSMGQILET